MPASRTVYLGKLLGLYCILIAVVMMSHKQTTVDTMAALVRDKGLVFMVLPPETSFAYFGAPLQYGRFFYLYMSITLLVGLYLTYASFRH